MMKDIVESELKRLQLHLTELKNGQINDRRVLEEMHKEKMHSNREIIKVTNEIEVLERILKTKEVSEVERNITR